MGMYTGLRFKAIIKKEYAEAIQQMMEGNLRWDEMKAKFPESRPLTVMDGYDRANFIPYGGVEHGYWEIEDDTAQYGYRTPDEWVRQFHKETREWVFQCSLKSIDTIHFFLEHVASEMVEEVIHIETLYCESRYSAVYDLVDGRIVENYDKSIDYYGIEDELYGY